MCDRSTMMPVGVSSHHIGYRKTVKSRDKLMRLEGIEARPYGDVREKRR